tara:strand:- start:9450 stop:9728 length:279 start_codon:yes stop_codon:yes gene_type:complete
MSLNFNGIMRTPTGVADRTEPYAMNRFVLRNTWNPTLTKLDNGKARAATPFRLVYNASDLPNQSGNPKYVYDSSVYSKFKKERAYRDTYNRN